MKRSIGIISLILFLYILYFHDSHGQELNSERLHHDEPESLVEKKLEDMVFIKGGCFDMGDTFGDGDADERPVHKVCLDDFYIGKYEVTVWEYRMFMEETGYGAGTEREDNCYLWGGRDVGKDKRTSWGYPGFTQTEKDPVVCIGWNDAKEYIKWKNQKTALNYRLPTEAEWEYAARSRGKDYKYSWGNGAPSGNIGDESLKMTIGRGDIWAGYNDGYVYTAPVGSFKPNDLGLYDMTGNAWEWVEDWYDEDYYKQSFLDNPKGVSSGKFKLLRGGSWYDKPRSVRVSDRLRDSPDARSSNRSGFRLALSPSALIP